MLQAVIWATIARASAMSRRSRSEVVPASHFEVVFCSADVHSVRRCCEVLRAGVVGAQCALWRLLRYIVGELG